MGLTLGSQTGFSQISFQLFASETSPAGWKPQPPLIICFRVYFFFVLEGIPLLGKGKVASLGYSPHMQSIWPWGSLKTGFQEPELIALLMAFSVTSEKLS